MDSVNTLARLAFLALPVSGVLRFSVLGFLYFLENGNQGPKEASLQNGNFRMSYFICNSEPNRPTGLNFTLRPFTIPYRRVAHFGCTFVTFYTRQQLIAIPVPLKKRRKNPPDALTRPFPGWGCERTVLCYCHSFNSDEQNSFT